MAAAVESHGLDGSKILESAQGPPLAPSDLAMIAGHPWGRHWLAAVPAMFAQGLAGYTDDHLADGPGWVTFDVADITSPVIVLHGARDVICESTHARHTAAIVPHAELRIIDGLGHLSIEDHIVPTIVGPLRTSHLNHGRVVRWPALPRRAEPRPEQAPPARSDRQPKRRDPAQT